MIDNIYKQNGTIDTDTRLLVSGKSLDLCKPQLHIWNRTDTSHFPGMQVALTSVGLVSHGRQ